MHERLARQNETVNENTRQLMRIADALERLIDLYDERTGVELNARYQFGKPSDRWRRKGA
jgi:hypothetical protein